MCVPVQASDVYSFGVILWEMYTGQRAWAALNFAQVCSLPVAFFLLTCATRCTWGEATAT